MLFCLFSALYSLYGLGAAGGMNPFGFPTGALGSIATTSSTTTAATSNSRNSTTSTSSSKKGGASKNPDDPNFGGLGTLGVAASQAASLGMNQASKFELETDQLKFENFNILNL